MLADTGPIAPDSAIVDFILNRHIIQVHGKEAALKTS